MPFLRAYGLAVLVTATIATFYPAVGTDPTNRSATVLMALRAGQLHDLSLSDPVGIISMPSFHAVGAVLATVGVWPIRALRWPIVILNTLMLCATVPMGAHYLVDVLAGVLVAAWAARVTGMLRLDVAARMR
jgi:membrane-associated phospholipid phosphatase